MFASSYLKRLTALLLLAFVLSASWLITTAIGTSSDAARSATNQPSPFALSSIETHAPSSHLTPTVPATALDQRYSQALLQLTRGLRPGRGDTIPAAADVHDLPVVDVSFYNWRGNLLSGWFALHTPQAPVIILTHGTPGNRVSMIQRAAFLYQHGDNVLLFDFQSYGKSQGVISTLGMVESEDILAAISYIHSLPATTDSKIGVLGLSMGATAAVLAAARSQDIVAVVAESCPVDATRVPGDVPDDASRDADRELVEDIYGVDITQARPIDVVNKLAGRSAIFFINGDNDGVTPLPGMQSLYQAAGMPKQFWVVPTAGHAQSFSVATSEYIERVSAFFDSYLAS